MHPSNSKSYVTHSVTHGMASINSRFGASHIFPPAKKLLKFIFLLRFPLIFLINQRCLIYPKMVNHCQSLGRIGVWSPLLWLLLLAPLCYPGNLGHFFMLYTPHSHVFPVHGPMDTCLLCPDAPVGPSSFTGPALGLQGTFFRSTPLQSSTGPKAQILKRE